VGTKWNDIRAARSESADVREGYSQAGAAYEFGMRVRNCREARGMSQAELAAAVGSSQSAVARLEAGGTQPTLRTMHALSRALGASWVITPDGVFTASGTGAPARARPA
jgi:transcriptional regulator with XRE-family HTH domain